MRDDVVRYMDRSRKYYEAHGYINAYRWAHYETVPIATLSKPLKDCVITLVTTAMPDSSFSGEKDRFHIGDMSVTPDSFYTKERFWDKDATHTDDVSSFFPIEQLRRLSEEGRIGGLSSRYYCVPTEYSQRCTIEHDAPAVLQSCIEDKVDAALLIPL